MFMKKEFELKYLVPPYALKLNCPMDKEPVRIEIWSWQANQTNLFPRVGSRSKFKRPRHWEGKRRREQRHQMWRNPKPQTPVAGRSVEEESDTSPGTHPEGHRGNYSRQHFHISPTLLHSPSGLRARYSSDKDVYVTPSPSGSPVKRIKEVKYLHEDLSSLEV